MPMRPKLEDLGDEGGVDLARAFHGGDEGADFFVGEGGDGVAEEGFVFGERS